MNLFYSFYVAVVYALSKIKIEKGIRKIQFTITKSYKLDIPREEQRRLAVEYGSVKNGILKEIGLTPVWKQGFENDFNKRK